MYGSGKRIRSTEVAYQAMPRRGATDTGSEQDRLSLPGCRVAFCGGDRPHGTRLTKNRYRPCGCRGIRIRHGLRDSHGESARRDDTGRRLVRVLCSWPCRAGLPVRVCAAWRARNGWCGPIRPRNLPIQWRAVPGTSRGGCFLVSSPCGPDRVLGSCGFASARRCDGVNTCSRPAAATDSRKQKSPTPRRSREMGQWLRRASIP